ncbi:MAG TPA: hypothetical protein VFH41_05475 [Bradyrhizobium sp.]|nr:hypothetical protein [Bradyrhizobium sp.]
MRRSQRLIASVVLLALSGALGGCSSGFGNWDPSDLLDIFDTKKKLPGERKPVFPDGVPGLEQGVPKELYKGAGQTDQQNPQAAAVTPPPEVPKSTSAKSKGKSKPAVAPDTAAAPDPNAAPEEDASAAGVPPAPKPKKVARKRTTAPPPDQTASQPDQSMPAQPTQQSASPFPAPLPGGTVTR